MAVRLYIGGLPPSVTPEELAQRFHSFGEVQSAELAPDKVYPPPRPGADPLRFPRSFGFVSLVPKDEKSLARVVAAYNGCAWRGSTLRCNVAKPAGLERIAAEKVEDEEEAAAAAAEALEPLPMAKEGTALRLRQPYRKRLVSVVLGGSEVTEEKLDGGAAAAPAPAAPAAPAPDHGAVEPEAGRRKTFEEHLRELEERQAEGGASPRAEAPIDAVLEYLDQQAAATEERKREARLLRASGGSRVAVPLSDSLWKPSERPPPSRAPKRRAAGAAAPRAAPAAPLPPPQRIRTVDFMSDADLQTLGGPPAADLSRFGSDSDDEGPPPRRAIPQVDGAGDSSSSDPDSESGSGSDGAAAGSDSDASSDSGSGSSDSDDSSSSSSDEDEGAAKQSSGSSGSSSDESSDGGGEAKKRRRGAQSDGSSSDSETSSDATAMEKAAQAEEPAGEAAPQGPGEDAAWMAGRLPAGAAFYRTEPMVQVEAAWRAGREAATRDVKERRRQALRQAGGGKRRA